MPVTLGAKPDHDFDQPLGLLSDCHRRIERFLGALATIAAQRLGSPLDGAELDVLIRARDYFRTAAPRHTRDEEESLFPRLRDSTDAGVQQLLCDVAQLEADHRAVEPLHTEVDALVTRWAETNNLPIDDTQRLCELLARLRETYHTHIAFEDLRLFPAAAQVLSDEQIHAVGREMAARRGIDWPRRGAP